MKTARAVPSVVRPPFLTPGADANGMSAGEAFEWRANVTAGAALNFAVRHASLKGRLTTDLALSIEFHTGALRAQGPSTMLTTRLLPLSSATGSVESPGTTNFQQTVPVGAGSVRVRLKGTSTQSVVIIGPVAANQFYSAGQHFTINGNDPENCDVIAKFSPAPTHRRVRISGLILASNKSTPPRFSVSFSNEEGRMLLPPDDTRYSPLYGPYVEFGTPAQGLASGSTEFGIPHGTTKIELRPIKWNSDPGLLKGELRYDPVKDTKQLIYDQLEGLSDDTPLILLDSTAPPIHDNPIVIRPINMSRQYSRLKNMVLYVGLGALNGARNRVNDYLLQFGREELEDIVEAVRSESLRRRCIYICSSFPTASAIWTADTLKAAGWTVFYEARDDMEDFRRVGYSKWYHPEAEARLSRRADVVHAVSRSLANKIISLAGSNLAVSVSPNAVRQDIAEYGRSLRTLASVEARRRKRIVGYVGHLTEAWFDWPAFLAAAHALPDVKFELIGPGYNARIRVPSNVSLYGPVPQERLQTYTKNWSLGLIPFTYSPLTRSVDPNKLFEYMSWALRTLSAPMGSIDECPSAFAFDNAQELIALVTRELSRPWSQVELDNIEDFLHHSTWESRARDTLKQLGGRFE